MKGDPGSGSPLALELREFFFEVAEFAAILTVLLEALGDVAGVRQRANRLAVTSEDDRKAQFDQIGSPAALIDFVASAWPTNFVTLSPRARS